MKILFYHEKNIDKKKKYCNYNEKLHLLIE